MPDPRDGASASDAEARAYGLVERTEEALVEGDLDTAVARLGELAEALGEHDLPQLLSRAMWVAGLVSLAQGRVDDFLATSADVAAGLDLEGDAAGARDARNLRAELLERADDELQVKGSGAVGFLDVLVRHAWRLVHRAAAEMDWAVIDRDRTHLGQLSAVAADDRDTPLPFARLVRGLELDPIEASLVAVLAAVGIDSELAAAARSLADEPAEGTNLRADSAAALCFESRWVRAAAIDRLAPRARLCRYRVVRVEGESPTSRRVEIDPDILWFLRDTPIDAVPLPRGAAFLLAEPGEVPVAEPLRAKVESLARAFVAPQAPVLAVSADPGAGASTACLAAAAAVERPLLSVDADRCDLDEPTMRALIRDAFLHGAILFVRCRYAPPPRELLWAAHERALRLVIAAPRVAFDSLMQELRHRRADIAWLEVPSIAPAEQVGQWQRVLAELGVDGLPEGEIEARLCRPSLLVGELVDTAVEALAKSELDASPVSVETIAGVLEDRGRRALGQLAELIDERSEPEIPLAAREPVDKISVEVGPSARGAVIAVVGGNARQRLEVTRALVAARSGPLARIDLASLLSSSSHQPVVTIAQAARSAAHAAATLLFEGVGHARASSPEVVTALVSATQRRDAVTVLAGAESSFPVAVASRVAHWIDLGPEELF